MGETSNPERGNDPSAVLLARWQERGDRNALDELLRVEIAILKRRVAGKGARDFPPEFSASDVAQEAAIRFLKVTPAPRFDSPSGLRAYMWTAAWRILLDLLGNAPRDVARIDALSSGALAPQLASSGGIGAVESRDQRVALVVAINLLGDQDREVLQIVYGEGLEIEGAAKRLSVAREAVKMRLVRARRNLAAKLKAWAAVVE